MCRRVPGLDGAGAQSLDAEFALGMHVACRAYAGDVACSITVEGNAHRGNTVADLIDDPDGSVRRRWHKFANGSEGR